MWKVICLSLGFASLWAVRSLASSNVTASPFCLTFRANGRFTFLGIVFSMFAHFWLKGRILGRLPFSGWLTVMVRCSTSMSFHSTL